MATSDPVPDPLPVVVYDPKKPYKAIYGGLMAALVSLGGAFTDGHVTVPEGIAVVLAALLAAGTVYGVKNPTV